MSNHGTFSRPWSFPEVAEHEPIWNVLANRLHLNIAANGDWDIVDPWYLNSGKAEPRCFGFGLLQRPRLTTIRHMTIGRCMMLNLWFCRDVPDAGCPFITVIPAGYSLRGTDRIRAGLHKVRNRSDLPPKPLRCRATRTVFDSARTGSILSTLTLVIDEEVICFDSWTAIGNRCCTGRN
jgi:hypothetical protein